MSSDEMEFEISSDQRTGKPIACRVVRLEAGSVSFEVCSFYFCKYIRVVYWTLRPFLLKDVRIWSTCMWMILSTHILSAHDWSIFISEELSCNTVVVCTHTNKREDSVLKADYFLIFDQLFFSCFYNQHISPMNTKLQAFIKYLIYWLVFRLMKDSWNLQVEKYTSENTSIQTALNLHIYKDLVKI